MANKIDVLFDDMLGQDGSDLHLAEGQKPKIRLHGEIHVLEKYPVLTTEAIREYLGEICPKERWEKFQKVKDLDFAYEKDEASRFRANYYFQINGMGAVFRIIPTKIMTLEDLGLPEVLKTFGELRSGLVLVTGPTGSGKSTTLAAIIDYINTRKARHIVTIEEPIEFVHPRKKSIICQREVGIDANSFADGLTVSGRQDVDVVLVGEMRDYITISLAIKAATMGPLVFGTLHTNSAIKTVDRIIDAFPYDQQDQVRGMLGESLKGVVAQLLLKKADGKGRLACNEILIGGQALSASIREGNINNIRNIIQGGKAQGMALMDDMLLKYLQEGQINAQEAYMKASDKKVFAEFVEGAAE